MALTGQCLCGAIRFTLSSPIRDVIACHCRQCARWSGSFVAATAVAPENFALSSGADAIAWFSASPDAERGFCRQCGSTLFWRPKDKSRLCVMAGALEPPTGLKTIAHIFLADKSDYYEISDAAPQFTQSCGLLAAAPTES